MKKIVNFFNGLISGAVVGVVLALLFAPASGEKLRTEVKGYVLQSIDDIRNAATDKRIELEKQLADLRKPASDSND